MSFLSAEAEASALRTKPIASSDGPRVAREPRVIRIGLLGLGNVGQAVARLAASPAGAAAGIQLRIDAALVRDVTRFRRCNRPSRITTNASAFLRGTYDVVIEALGGLEPARTIVARLLRRGVPVVTANKTLIAEAGEELRALATARGTTLRYEASAIAGVPFLGTLAARPLVSNIDRFAAVLNGTSNFILSVLEANGGTFANALALAEQQGLTEPDPSRDLDGDDAADKLALLASLFGWGRVTRTALEVSSVRHVSSTDLRVARSLGGALKPLAIARRAPGGIEACIGPTWVPGGTPLAALGGTLNGIEFHGRHIRDLFFSGPGAGPDVTAATLLDDVFESVRGLGESKTGGSKDPPLPVCLASPHAGVEDPPLPVCLTPPHARVEDAPLPVRLASLHTRVEDSPLPVRCADGASLQVNAGLEDSPLPVRLASPHAGAEDSPLLVCLADGASLQVNAGLEDPPLSVRLASLRARAQDPSSVYSTSLPERMESPFLPASQCLESVHTSAPITPWFVRLEFPGVVPTPQTITEIVGHTGLYIEHVTDAVDEACYVLVGRADRHLVDAALGEARRRHRVRGIAFRRLERTIVL